MSPGRWHDVQFAKKIGATSLLNVGAAADIAILELREGEFEFLDNYENKIKGSQRLFPSETVLGGARVPRV